jgi:hypothetical protein
MSTRALWALEPQRQQRSYFGGSDLLIAAACALNTLSSSSLQLQRTERLDDEGVLQIRRSALVPAVATQQTFRQMQNSTQVPD